MNCNNGNVGVYMVGGGLLCSRLTLQAQEVRMDLIDISVKFYTVPW